MIDPQNFLSYAVWLGLPEQTRMKIAALFGIGRNGIRETHDSRVVSDGFRHIDLAVITKEKMSEILGEKSDDFYALFNKIVEKVEQPEEIKQQNDVQQEKQTQEDGGGLEAGAVGGGKKRGRKAKGKAD